jgi:hypothetical protein
MMNMTQYIYGSSNSLRSYVDNNVACKDQYAKVISLKSHHKNRTYSGKPCFTWINALQMTQLNDLMYKPSSSYNITVNKLVNAQI